MNKTRAYYISHCDYYNCDLGSFEYTCPACNRTNHDYDELWSRHDEILDRETVNFNCEYCKQPLKIYWDREEMECYVDVT